MSEIGNVLPRGIKFHLVGDHQGLSGLVEPIPVIDIVGEPTLEYLAFIGTAAHRQWEHRQWYNRSEQHMARPAIWRKR